MRKPSVDSSIFGHPPEPQTFGKATVAGKGAKHQLVDRLVVEIPLFTRCFIYPNGGWPSNFWLPSTVFHCSFYSELTYVFRCFSSFRPFVYI